MVRSPFALAPMEGRTLEEEQEQHEVLLIHSQVSRIKREDEETRRHLLMKLQLLETMPAAGGGIRGHESSPPASRSLSPLRRAGDAVPVGDWA
ncbi:uncharacterized protein LOC124656079 [Lolium rigidum]|uniref:uncharacterized protein LOC124656079 n=1 Tax=Lolium rigidum TaxID=89674 RepID=UPI001F5E32DA|nr:uncharacterized protein LOC124656079 [Lolium rigidum]